MARVDVRLKSRMTLLCAVCAGIWLAAVGGLADSDPFAALKLSRLGAGTEAPPFALPALGEPDPLRSEDLLGKVVLLNFWATWCGPCKEEMPALQRLQQHFSSKPFAVVAVTADLQPAAIRAFLTQVGATFPNALDEHQDVSRAYWIRGLPTTVIIDRQGRVVGRAVGPRAWDGPDAAALIERLLDS
jgi:thiol-disulfide isomerase/thioredoxin